MFLRSVLNHCIDDESLIEYFYEGQDNNNEAVLDTIAGGFIGSVLILRLLRSWKKSLDIIKLEELGNQILGETLL